MPKIPLRLIYLRNAGCVLTKKKYNDWREVQDDYDDYMTDMLFADYQDIIEFFEEDFKDERSFPFSKEEITSFAQSDDEVIFN